MKSENLEATYHAVLYIQLLPGSCIAVLAVSCSLCVCAFLHCSITLAFGHQFLTVEACVRYGEGHVVFVVD